MSLAACKVVRELDILHGSGVFHTPCNPNLNQSWVFTKIQRATVSLLSTSMALSGTSWFCPATSMSFICNSLVINEIILCAT